MLGRGTKAPAIPARSLASAMPFASAPRKACPESLLPSIAERLDKRDAAVLVVCGDLQFNDDDPSCFVDADEIDLLILSFASS